MTGNTPTLLLDDAWLAEHMYTRTTSRELATTSSAHTSLKHYHKNYISSIGQELSRVSHLTCL